MKSGKNILKGKNFFSAIREKARDFAYIHNAKNRQNLREYIDKLYETHQTDLRVLSKLLKKSGLHHIYHKDGTFNTKVNDYPDIKALNDKIEKDDETLQQLFRKYPELWIPGKDDISLTYDWKKVQSEMMKIFHQEEGYLKDLLDRIDKLSEKTGQEASLGDARCSADVVLDSEIDADKAELLNEQFYLTSLYWDVVATIGDKWDNLLRKSVPKIAEKKYIKFMNDKMVELLASDETLASYISHFELVLISPDLKSDFIKRLTGKLKETFLAKSGKKLDIEIINERLNGAHGSYSLVYKKFIYNIAYWKSADFVIGSVKHEFMGHCLNDLIPNMGLYGEKMRNFIHNKSEALFDLDFFGTVPGHSMFKSTLLVPTKDVCARSPLTRTDYSIQNLTDEEEDKIYDSGWEIFHCPVQSEIWEYRNGFEEHSAVVLSPTKNICKQVAAFRSKHGLSQAGKNR